MAELPTEVAAMLPPPPPPPPPPETAGEATAAAAGGDGADKAWENSQGNNQGAGSSSGDEVKTLWIGDLQYWMDEAYLHSCFAFTGEVQTCKLIRNKQTGMSEGYGFVEFSSHEAAEGALNQCNGAMMPNTEQAFRLNWATFGIGERRPDGHHAGDFSIFVGDVGPDANDAVLLQTFKEHYPSVRSAKVVTDPAGRSKGYGFVRFGDENERNRAMAEMQGQLCMGRPMRISQATPKKAGSAVPNQGPAQPYNPPGGEDPTNTTIFVGGLDPAVPEEELRKIFGTYGELVYVKIPPGKGCGFVQFVHRPNAEDALQKLHGFVIGTQPVRLTWGRSPTGKRGPPGPMGYQGYNQDPWGAYYQQGYDPNYGAWGVDPYTGYPQQGGYQGRGGQYGYPQAEGQYPWGTTPGMDGMQGQPGQAQTQGQQQQSKEETEDPLAPPDVDKLNAVYITRHQEAFSGRHQWLRTAQQALGQPTYRV